MQTAAALVKGINILGERIQNCQNEDEALDVTYSCSRFQDQIRVIWQLRPIEPRQRWGTTEPHPRAPLRLVVVLDASHSMAEPYGPDDNVSKLDKIKLFTQLLARSMNEDDSLGVVTFGTHAKVALALTPMSEEAKQNAIAAVDEITLSGVTNMSAGVFAAIEQFRAPYSKSAGGGSSASAFRPSLLQICDHPELAARHAQYLKQGPQRRYFNDNIILFTDGMANEGLVDSVEVIEEMKRRISAVKSECRYNDDYTIKLSTLGTGGFLPELLYNIGKAFSSDAFYFLDEATNLELNLMKPVLLRDTALVTSLQTTLTTHHNVTLDRSRMTNEYEVIEEEDGKPLSDNTANYYIHDIAADAQRHLVCSILLPKKHKKLLKDKDVMTLVIKFRDKNLQVRTVQKTICYSDIPPKENKTIEKDLVILTEQDIRITAQRALDKASDFMMRLDRTKARAALQSSAQTIRDFIEKMFELLSQESQEYLTHKTEPMLANLDHYERILADMSIRWDDAWARLKALSSAFAREVPTAIGVCADGAEMFVPPQIDERMEYLIGRLREIYVSLGLSTETIDKYKTVMKELQQKLAKMEEDGEVKESRI